MTPCGSFDGIEINEEAACAVSIIRAGDSMLEVCTLDYEWHFYILAYVYTYNILNILVWTIVYVYIVESYFTH